jgi:PBP1b-binding outer membrane lipoprotein LpoB
MTLRLSSILVLRVFIVGCSDQATEDLKKEHNIENKALGHLIPQ